MPSGQPFQLLPASIGWMTIFLVTKTRWLCRRPQARHHPTDRYRRVTSVTWSSWAPHTPLPLAMGFAHLQPPGTLTHLWVPLPIDICAIVEHGRKREEDENNRTKPKCCWCAAIVVTTNKLRTHLEAHCALGPYNGPCSTRMTFHKCPNDDFGTTHNNCNCCHEKKDSNDGLWLPTWKLQ